MTKRGRPPYPDVLTPREWEVLSLLREGLTNEAVAERLGVTVHAARYHVAEILSKLGVATREEAAAWQPQEAPDRRWERALGLAMGLAALVLICALGVLAWSVLRGSESDAQAGAIATGTPGATDDTQFSGHGARDMQIIDEDFAWIWYFDGLFRTRFTPEGDRQPVTRITPEGLDPFWIRGIHFLDNDHGWLIATIGDQRHVATQFLVYRTTDGGDTWDISPLDEPSVADDWAGSPSIDFRG